MPPRIPLSQVARCCRTSIERSGVPGTARTPLASLFAALSIRQTPARPATAQTRSASILANLRDNKGAYNKRIRKGRGPSSGYGKTSGRGHKGQGQHGHVKPWFQGGQTPLIFKHGSRGFVNHRKDVMSEVNLDRLQAWVDAGRIDPKKPITPKEIIQSGLLGRPKDGVKLLARGSTTVHMPLEIVVSRASAAAIEAVEKAGGKIITRYYTKSSIRRLLKGESVHTVEPLPVGEEHVQEVLEKARSGPYKYRLPDPTSRWDIEYYRDPAHRGYLSHLLKPGESPSLYFKVPGERIAKKSIKVKKVDQGDTRLF
ncbi:50S ribosomal subunit protein L15 [Diaporthe helianthi]|uniref:50S ribosomal subunit protein L15 n=1 Tax=Diaporthe helianthi TaxID=158607 RepID=A0A2P5HXR9_DIAHE|nr:50S ribosomal subunit protein L15 [Diaporthe helianthi]